MRRPRLLALLILLAVLLALGAWTLMQEHTGAVENALASATEPEAARDALLAVEPEALPQRQEAAAPIVPLANSNRIRGRVVRGSLSVPVAGVEVRCTKDFSDTPAARRARLKAQTRTFMSTSLEHVEESPLKCTSSPDGSFEFPDLDRAARYTLRALATGGGIVEPLIGIVPSEEECTLVVRRIYRALVLATDEDGKPPERACEYLRYARVAGPGECKSLPLEEPDAKPSKEPGAEYAFTSDCEVPRLGPFRILICCPGYQRQDFEFWAYPEGVSLEATVLHLRRSLEKTGELHVRQKCECTQPRCSHLLNGRLDLESVEDAQKTLSFDLSWLAREQEFTDVPAGRWRGRIHAQYLGFCHPTADLPAIEITIGDEPAVIEIPVSNLGAVSFVDSTDTSPFESRPLEWEEPGGVRQSTSVQGRLVMHGVEAGTHRFESEGAVLRVDVIAGQVVNVPLGKP